MKHEKNSEKKLLCVFRSNASLDSGRDLQIKVLSFNYVIRNQAFREWQTGCKITCTFRILSSSLIDTYIEYV